MYGKPPIWKEDCPFCKEEPKLVIQNFKHWKFIHNKYPYEGAKKHTLLIPKRHVEHTKELSSEELLELASIETYIETYYVGEDYFSFIRQSITGKSICHIHYHYISGALYADALSSILQNQN